MNPYEILLMLDPELPEERQNEIIARTRELVERAGGTWQNHQLWGRRRLAYEIDKKAEGSYHLLLFESAPEALDELTRILKITDGVMRHLAVRQIEGSNASSPPPAPGPSAAAPAPAPAARPSAPPPAPAESEPPAEAEAESEPPAAAAATAVQEPEYDANTRSQEEES